MSNPGEYLRHVLTRQAPRQLPQIIGANLRTARLRRGLTQPQLAAMIGIESFQITRWEGGKHRPRDKTLLALAEALEVPLSELFVEEPDGAAA